MIVMFPSTRVVDVQNLDYVIIKIHNLHMREEARYMTNKEQE